MKIIKERFDLIGKFSGIRVYDVNHAVEEFHRWFPDLTMTDYKNFIFYGVEQIKRKFGFSRNNYMIISKSKGIRIPIEVKPDYKIPLINIGVIATTLNPKELKNLRNEVEIFVEANKNTFSKFPITENFNYYTQHGEIFTDYEEIEVE